MSSRLWWHIYLVAIPLIAGLFILAACGEEVTRSTPTPTPMAVATPTSPPPTVTPVAVSPQVSQLVVAEGIDDKGQAVGVLDIFGTGTKAIYGVFKYAGFAKGTRVTFQWLLGGAVRYEKSDVWDKAPEGSSWTALTDPNGLPGGTYQVKIFVGDKEMASKSFLVVTAATATPQVVVRPTATPVPPPPATAGIVLTIQKYDYAQWGRPAGMDDPTKGCRDFNNAHPMRKLTASLRIENRSGQELREWFVYFYKPDGSPVYTCYQAYEGALNVIPPGQGRDITFTGYVEPNETVAYGIVRGNIGNSNRVYFP